MELWDVYDQYLQKTGRTHVRGEEMPEGDYHLTVHVYPVNHKGEILIQKRADTVKTKPGMWAITGGSVIAGEELFEGCCRELREELGIAPPKEDFSLLSITQKPGRYRCVWIVRSEAKLSELTLQKEEVADVKWATPQMILEMIEKKEFWEYDYLDWIFEKIEQFRESGWITKDIS